MMRSAAWGAMKRTSPASLLSVTWVRRDADLFSPQVEDDTDAVAAPSLSEPKSAAVETDLVALGATFEIPVAAIIGSPTKIVAPAAIARSASHISVAIAKAE